GRHRPWSGRSEPGARPWPGRAGRRRGSAAYRNRRIWTFVTSSGEPSATLRQRAVRHNRRRPRRRGAPRRGSVVVVALLAPGVLEGPVIVEGPQVRSAAGAGAKEQRRRD